MPDWLALYHRLPYPLKSAAAGARGRYLSRWRYGPDAEALVEETLARDTWSPAQWAAWQEERLAFVLHRAATNVPYYREQWARRRQAGDRAAWDQLANWPVLAKNDLRLAPRAFVADDCRTDDMFYEHTSGTTGTPLHIWLSRPTVQAWFAIYEARARRWYGVSRHDRWAILGGQLVAPISAQKPPFWVWNGALNQLYLSAYHLSAANIPAYLAALADHEVTFLLGYPSAIYRLAQAAREQGLVAPQLRVAIGNAEPLLAHQREAIAAVFGCPVRDTYGMAEIAAAASECEQGALHIWPEVGLIETLADEGDGPATAGQPGRLVATGLLNTDMPLIRYETGDRCRPEPDAAVCACGRPLPRLAGLEGRMDDVVITPDGRHIGRLDPVFKADLPIREAQIIQETRQGLRVLYVPTEAYSAQDGEALIRRIRDRVGEMDVALEAVDEIPRTANGKFRAVISRLPKSDPDLNAETAREDDDE
jgi:phenylacetate-CoA ligase